MTRVSSLSHLIVCAALAALAALLAAVPVQAIQLPITAAVDTTLRQDQTGDNFGAFNRMWVGNGGPDKTPTAPLRRGLLEFDLSAVPAGATINSATLTMQCTNFHTLAQNIRLHRALVDWGEGVKTGKGGGAATAGEASWTNRITGTAAWGAAGGLAGTDYVAAYSAQKNVTGTGSFIWDSAGLLADVRNWYTTPSTNYGWFLISDQEGAAGEVVRFATSEDTGTAPSIKPLLTIDYTLASPSLFGVSSGPTPATLRVMKGSTQSSAVVVQNTGGSAGDMTITSPNLVTVTPSSQTGVAASGIVNLAVRWSDVTNTGARTGGSFNVHNATNAADPDNLVSLSGAVLDNRGIASPKVDFGRFAVNSTANKTLSATLATSGDSNSFTNVTLNSAAATNSGDGITVAAGGSNVLFNAAGVTATRNVTLNKLVTATGLVDSNVGMSVSGEGLTGEVDAATVPYKYNVVGYRTVSGPASLNLGNILQGATVTVPLSLTSATGNDASVTRVSVANQTSNGLTLGGTPIVFDGSVGTNSRTATFVAATPGTVNATANFAITGEGIGDTSYTPVSIPFSGVVGNATAKATPAGVSGAAATFDAAKAMIANVTTSVAALSSSVTAGGAANSTGKLLAGTVPVAGQVTMNWRTPADDEKGPSALFPDSLGGIISDVLDLTGTGTGNVALEISYEPSLIIGGAGREASLAASDGIRVSWLNGGVWQNAGSGKNQGPWPAYAASHGITNPDAPITGGVGDWGVDTSTHTAWVIINHNSQFAVVPEPGTLMLLGLAGLMPAGWLCRRWWRGRRGR